MGKIKDSKIVKEALRRLIKRHQKVFEALAMGSQLKTNKGEEDVLS